MPRCSAGAGSALSPPTLCGAPSTQSAGGLSMLLSVTATCETPALSCNPACLNGGICLSAIGQCSCNSNYTGNACQFSALAATTIVGTGGGSDGTNGGGTTTDLPTAPPTAAASPLGLILGLAIGIPAAVLIGAGIAITVYFVRQRQITQRTSIAMAKISGKMVD